MRNFFVTLILIMVLGNNLEAQKSSRNGEIFTPKDSLKALVVFVGFKDYDTLLNNVWGWSANQKFPDVVRNGHLFYDDFSMFDLPINEERDINNISRWYYEMSKLSGRPLKIIANAVRVDIDYIIKKDYIAIFKREINGEIYED